MAAFRIFLRLFFSLGICWASLSTASAVPTLVITNVPAYGTSGNLQGFVLGANIATQAIAAFIYVPGYGWVSKPTCAQPLTPIMANGSWSANISTGGGDVNATRVAALLVPTNYTQPCVLGLPNLPTNVYAQALAKSGITRPSPGLRFLSFSGYDWWVKNYSTPIGPGPNYFSDLANNVWMDTNGWLHLRITHRTNAWQCAEIVSARTFGPGSYRFELNSPADSLDPNITLGLFTWSDDPSFADREIDVECSRWNNIADTNNSQFVVQPFDTANHLLRYRVPPAVSNSTHLFVWETNRISFQSQGGAYNPTGANLISSWVFTNASAVPQSGDENVRMNFWLHTGNPPNDNNEAEVVIKSFEFVPLGTPPRPLFIGQRLVAGRFQFTLAVQPDYQYQIQTSSNFLSWVAQSTLLATNTTLNFADTNAPTLNARFYRSIALP